PAKTKIDSNKLTYEFSTLTNNCGVDKYIPFGMSEESAPNWLISSVNPGWKYYVDIYVTPNETILDKTNEITISFEMNVIIFLLEIRGLSIMQYLQLQMGQLLLDWDVYLVRL
ncbi:MAG: hypothetical protein PUB89_05965, partial [Oscillospiraceae bacterium]|nr:hypothetical protein [Oscillospiraceae bacterium]